MSRTRTDCEGFHRRDFLRFGLGAAGALGLSPAAAARAGTGGTATGVIQVWLSGGPATIDMWDLKPDAPESIRGEFRPIETTAPGVLISEHMPRLAQVTHRCALVRSLSHPVSAHGPGTVYMATGNRPSAALDYPALGSLAARLLPPRRGVPPYVTFGPDGGGAAEVGPGHLGPAFAPFRVDGDPAREGLRAQGVALPDGFSLRDLENRDALRARFDRGLQAAETSDLMSGLDVFHGQALEVLRSDRVRAALDLSREPERVRDDYGRSPLGQGLLAARRLIEAGARFVTVGFGGWDTHGDNFRALRDRLLPTLDQGLAALIRDTAARGLLDETLIVCAGEFGRTPWVNAQAGRDHWSQAMAALLAGGGIPGGVVHGATDARGTAPSRDVCSPDDLAATIVRRLGFGPRHEVRSTSGRPIALFREGAALAPLGS